MRKRYTICCGNAALPRGRKLERGLPCPSSVREHSSYLTFVLAQKVYYSMSLWDVPYLQQISLTPFTPNMQEQFLVGGGVDRIGGIMFSLLLQLLPLPFSLTTRDTYRCNLYQQGDEPHRENRSQKAGNAFKDHRFDFRQTGIKHREIFQG